MKKIKNGIFVIGLGTALLLVTGLSEYLLYASHASAISVKPTPSLPTAVADMNRAIAANSGDLQASASLIDLDDGLQYDAGESQYVFQAASTAKLLAAIDYLHDVEQGQASLGQSLNGTSAQQQLKQMIEVSDNNAWLAVNNYLGNQQSSYAESVGIHDYTGNGYNTMSTGDEARLLKQLYEGKLINESHRALLYSYMAHTDSTNLIPAALPANATVYNKYGQIYGELHDAAIVTYQGHHFVLVIFTKNSDNTTDEYDNQVALIHAITRVAFEDITAS